MFTDIPLVCNKCLSNKKYVTFVKDNNMKKCVISGFSFFPFTVNVNGHNIKTIICKEIAILKLICQVCLLNVANNNNIKRKPSIRIKLDDKSISKKRNICTTFFRINSRNNEFEELYNEHELFRFCSLKINNKYGIEYLSLNTSDHKGKLRIVIGNKRFQFFNLKYFIRAFYTSILKQNK
ncbi:RNA binding protein (nucleomorph) [Bigelowiella natans]|uniref:RNA binding protein n=1 Tax=Bigelowiella natans TaxID=227086 RepID=Q3LW73_BIGNA|nr:RNA binding protein [Bigelowiella natans]ABA27293.1 RNA binding protein [Bigelowiella natans]|mmetsp:Transcript_5163/g.8445  ORF Transcript_5163/g.8445 Transcript_5163/m.8445 type:complete len:180 (-) Transcript_5163:5290-5829(-)